MTIPPRQKPRRHDVPFHRQKLPPGNGNRQGITINPLKRLDSLMARRLHGCL